MSMTHVSDARLAELMQGVASASDRAHVEGCPHCGGRLEQAREGLRLAACADVPEPSPLYWEAFRRQVGRRIEAEERGLRRWRIGSLVAVAALLLLVASVAFEPARRAPGGAATLPAWSALPPADEDPGLPLLAALAGEADAGAECALPVCIEELSEDETRAAADLLRREMGGREL